MSNASLFSCLQRELEKQRQLEQNRQQITMATQHYAYTLFKKFGMLPWRRLVEMSRENMSRAVLHHNLVLQKCCFYPWLEFTRRVNEERLEAAQVLYKRILLRRAWRQWRKVIAACLCLDFLLFPIFSYNCLKGHYHGKSSVEISVFLFPHYIAKCYQIHQRFISHVTTS